jgi:hypothetical protein
MRHHVRSLGAVAIALAFALNAVSQAHAAPLPPPRVLPNAAWLTVTTGPTNSARALPQLFAVTAKPNPPRGLVPYDLYDGLKQLQPAAAVIVTSTLKRGGYSNTLPGAPWPPRLSAFRVDHGWKGQPAAQIQQRLFAVTTAGWLLDIRIYFGTQHPSHQLLRKVDTELSRLRLPR